MGKVKVDAGQSLLVDNIAWKDYLRISRAFDDRPAWRLTYDRGLLEIMNISYEHAGYGHLLGRFVVVLTEELDLPVAGGGSTTFRRRKKQRGLEPDECYWIAHEVQVRGKTRIDLRTDPPPDLAVEVDITHSSVDRMAVYGSLGVPEVWRFDGQVLTFNLLGAKRKYSTVTSSRNFPGLLPGEILRFMNMRGQSDENELVRQFRTWLRQQIAAGVMCRPTP